jgi:hypothetical protein
MVLNNMAIVQVCVHKPHTACLLLTKALQRTHQAPGGGEEGGGVHPLPLTAFAQDRQSQVGGELVLVRRGVYIPIMGASTAPLTALTTNLLAAQPPLLH